MSEETKRPLDPDIRELIRKKATRLVRKRAILHRDLEDVEQELILDILHCLPKLDAAKGGLQAFIASVVERRISKILRDRRASKRGQGRTSSLDTCSPDDPSFARLDENLAHADLGMDVNALILQLPMELRQVAELMQLHSVTTTAQALGICRGIVYARLGEIRAVCERTGLRKYLANSSDSSRADGVVS